MAINWVGHREKRRPAPVGWPLLIASCRECRRLQHLDAERFEVTADGASQRCPFCNVAFAVRWEDAVVLGVVDVVRDMSLPVTLDAPQSLHQCA